MSFLDSQKYYKNISTVFIPPDYWTGSYYCRGTAMLGPEMYYEALKLEKEIKKNRLRFVLIDGKNFARKTHR